MMDIDIRVSLRCYIQQTLSGNDAPPHPKAFDWSPSATRFKVILPPAALACF